jgi:hypothetical protein
MTDDFREPREEELLDRLIRQSEQEAEPSFVRPSDEAILAYLTGRADENLRQSVIEALVRSKEVRREVLLLAQDLEEFRLLKGASDDLRMEEFAVPDRVSFLKEQFLHTITGGEAIDDNQVSAETVNIRLPGSVTSTGLDQSRKEVARPKVLRIVARDGFGAKLLRWRIPQVYIPALAAVATLVILMVHFGSITSDRTPTGRIPAATGLRQAFQEPAKQVEWPHNGESIELSLLVAIGGNRGVSVDETSSYSNPKDAALAEFRSRLSFKDGKFSFAPEESLPSSTPPYRRLFLQFADSSGVILADFKASIPLTIARMPSSVTAWILTIPERNLYRLDLPSDTVAVTWNKLLSEKGCVAFTYASAKGYKSAAGLTFELH